MDVGVRTRLPQGGAAERWALPGPPFPRVPCPPLSHAAHPSLGHLGDDLSHIPPSPVVSPQPPEVDEEGFTVRPEMNQNNIFVGGVEGAGVDLGKGGLRAQTWGLASEPTEGRTPGGAGVTAQEAEGPPFPSCPGGHQSNLGSPLGKEAPPVVSQRGGLG